MKKVSLRKVVSIFLAMCMIFSSLACTVAFADVEKTVYISSENFTTANGDGTWDNGVWQAQLHDFNLPGTTEQSTQAEFTNNPGEYFPISNTYSGSYSSTSTGNDHLVGAESLRAPLFSLDSVEETRDFGVVKTFIAPKLGNITISCDTELKANMANVLLAYVIKEKNDGTLELLKFIPLNSTSNAWSGNVTTAVKKGEKIHFEVKRRTSYNQQVATWSSEVTWDPMITYNKITSDADATIYTSSEYFNTLSCDGTWDNGIWSARVYDMNEKTNTVITEVATYDGKDAYTLNFDTGKALYIYSGGMTPAGGVLTTENATWPEITFTAPKSGKITVSVNGSVDISAAGSGNTVANYTGYINNVEGTNMVTIGSWSGTTNLWPGDKTIYIQKGETINFRFQPASATSNLTRWVKIDPKITYLEKDTYTPEQRNVYKSSDNFGEDAVNGYKNSDGNWDNGIWSAQIHKFVYGENNAEISEKGLLANKGEYTPMYYYDGQFYASTILQKDHIVGANKVRTPLLTNESYEALRDLAVVKTFTVPRKGTVNVSRDEEIGLKTVGGAYYLIAYVIHEKKDGTAEVKRFIPLNANNTDLWVSSWGEADITFMVEEGDKIHFEVKRRVANNSSVGGNNLEVSWDPIVAYTDNIAYTDITFVKNGENVTSFADIASGTVDVKINVIMSYLTEAKDVYSFVAVYDDEGNLVSCAKSDAAVTVNPDSEEKELSFTLVNSKDLTNGQIKVFIFAENTIMPLMTSNSTLLLEA